MPFIICIITSLLAGAIAFGFTKKVIPTILATLISGVAGFCAILWVHPAIGIFYPDIYLWIILSTIISGFMVLFFKESPYVFSIPVGILVIFLLFAGLSSCEMGRTDRYHDLVGKVTTELEFGQNVPMADPAHMRMIPKKTALILAQKTLGQSLEKDVILGSQLKIDVDSAAIQEINGEQWWVFPLDFISFWKWLDLKNVPGYIRVSAENPDIPAQLVEINPVTGNKFELKYTRNAFFSAYLDRKIYFEYPNIAREDFTFEVDNNWKPYYVISATSPNVGFNGYKTKGVIIFDPQTGKSEFKSGNEIPAWVDRIIPLNQALNLSKWWGKYTLNSWWDGNMSGKGVKKPTSYAGGNDMWFVRLGNANYWFTGMTSHSDEDTSLVGGLFMNTRTGKTFYYPMQGTDENGVVATIDSALGADSARWDPVMPIPSNIHGSPTWVVSIISDTGYFQKIAFVDINNVNTFAIAKTKERALRDYRIQLNKQGNLIAPSESGNLKSIGPLKVLRVGDTVLGGEKMRYLLLEGITNCLFSSSGETLNTRLIAIVQTSDLVTLNYLDTQETVVNIEEIQIAGINLIQSENQRRFENQQKVTNQHVKSLDSSQKIEKSWEHMTPGQKREMMN